MDTARLLDALRIPYTTEGKNATRNGLSVRCPFCDDPSNHGSFHKYSLHYRCWRCKGGKGIDALKALSGANDAVIAQAMRNCGGPAIIREEAPKYADTLTLPGRALLPYHRNYLMKRGLDPDYIVQRYGIRGTSPFDKFEGLNYANRIIIPIYDLDGNLVSFQGRDVTGMDGVERYKVCPIKKARMHYKDTVYAGHLATGDKVIVLEGVVDVWKFGPGAVATFGTGCKKSQILALTNWRDVVFFFDPEKDAQNKAREYAEELALMGVRASVAYEDFGTTSNGKKRDVGDLEPHEIIRIRSELGV